jgi:hypothetical protein
LVSHNVQQRSHEHVGCCVSCSRPNNTEVSVLEVRRVDATAVKLIIEQAGREGPVSKVRSVQRHGEGSAGDAAEGDGPFKFVGT